MKTFAKTFARMFKKHLMRFLSIIFIVTVSVGLTSGVGSSAEVINRSLTEYYQTQNVSDFIVKSTAAEGFTSEQIEAVRTRYGENNVNVGMSVDVDLPVNGTQSTVRLYFLDFSNWTVNVPTAVEEDEDGVKTYVTLDLSGLEAETQFLSADANNTMGRLEEGATFTLDFAEILKQLAEQGGQTLDESQLNMMEQYLDPIEVTSAGIVQSPIAFDLEGEPSYIQEEGVEIPDVANALDELNTLDYIFYFSADVIPSYGDLVRKIVGEDASDETVESLLALAGIEASASDLLLPDTGDLYLAFADRELFRAFSGAYESEVEAEQAALSELLGEGAEFITLRDNFSFKSLHEYANRVMAIGLVLAVAFIFVTALVVLSSMTRLLEEERGQIACLRTLGYTGTRIIGKYLLFAVLGTAVGGFASYFVGVGLTAFIYEVFNYSYVMPPMTGVIESIYFAGAFVIIFVAMLVATAIAGGKLMRETPADLLRPKPPKAGKKVFLERIKIIWNRLSFKYKSTMRNVLRYGTRFAMTVISVAFSMGLVLAGLALLDLCLFQDFGSPALIGLSSVIVVFAGLLTMIVIYTLTNINVSERNREIATLMVLGYFDGEVTGYIYREVYINTIVGIIFGYPVGVFLMQLLFRIMNIGSLAGVSWFIWLAAPVVVLLFTGLVTIILRRKIVGIDMNESLKAIE